MKKFIIEKDYSLKEISDLFGRSDITVIAWITGYNSTRGWERSFETSKSGCNYAQLLDFLHGVKEEEGKEYFLAYSLKGEGVVFSQIK